jgi:hypothetical protein
VNITVTTAGGTSATSSADRFKFVAVPAITTQPGNVTVTAGQSATFQVAASGDGLSYQRQKKVPAARGSTSHDGSLACGRGLIPIRQRVGLACRN